MAERRASGLRPIGMRKPLVGLLLALSLVVCSCGNTPGDEGLNDLPKTGAAACLSDDQVGSAPVLLNADIDGRGEPDLVQLASGSGECRNVLFTRADGKRPGVEVTGDLPVDPHVAAAIQIPGRQGVLVMLTLRHPRGGFQARLFGYADSRLEELTVGGDPVFPFVATDVLTDPLSARCVAGGFEVLQGRRHEPIGVVPAWDVFRTTYSVDGNTVTEGPTTEVADNVLDKEFATKYADLVHYRLFTNCRVGS
jgi:hypothetical protein